MPSPSDLAWWWWLLIAAGAWLICGIIHSVNEDSPKTEGCVSILFMIAFGVIGTSTALIAAIRFIKWVWSG